MHHTLDDSSETEKMTKKLGDHIRRGSFEEISEALERFARSAETCSSWAEANLTRTDRRIALQNILLAAGRFAMFPASSPGTVPVQILALATRGVFELNLRARHILMSDEHLAAWFAEALRDKAQLYEGILKLIQSSSQDAAAILQREVESARGVAQRRDLDIDKRPPSTEALAKAVGLANDYEALFKLYSKLVHPTSFAVNFFASEVNGWAVRDALLIQLQAYGHDLLERTCCEFGAPAGTIDNA